MKLTEQLYSNHSRNYEVSKWAWSEFLISPSGQIFPSAAYNRDHKHLTLVTCLDMNRATDRREMIQLLITAFVTVSASENIFYVVLHDPSKPFAI
jgi:hypothetical protein